MRCYIHIITSVHTFFRLWKKFRTWSFKRITTAKGVCIPVTNQKNKIWHTTPTPQGLPPPTPQVTSSSAAPPNLRHRHGGGGGPRRGDGGARPPPEAPPSRPIPVRALRGGGPRSRRRRRRAVPATEERRAGLPLPGRRRRAPRHTHQALLLPLHALRWVPAPSVSPLLRHRV